MSLVHTRGFDAAVFAESPWYRWLEPALSQVAGGDAFPAPDVWTELHTRVALKWGIPALRFTPAPAKKPRRRRRSAPIVLAELYEGGIVERGQVQTRPDDWHDFFNALAFLAFPRAKWALHARQYRRIAERIAPHARRLPGARTREQDALALFDEGGIALAVSAQTAEQLVPGGPDFEQRLASLLHEGRARSIPFGHALFEHLVLGRSDMLGSLFVVPVDPAGLACVELRTAVDGALAHALADPQQFLEPSPERGRALSTLVP